MNVSALISSLYVTVIAGQELEAKALSITNAVQLVDFAEKHFLSTR